MTRLRLAPLLLLLAACQSPEADRIASGAGSPSDNTPTAAPAPPAITRGEDLASVAGMIVPPGARVTSTLELDPYDDLVQGYPDLTPETLIGTYFKDAHFRDIDDPDFNFQISPRADVIIKRDARWQVPHVYGETDAGAFFGAGYVTAEDRGPIIELLRALGNYEAFDTAGTAASWLADAEMVRLYGYTDDEFNAQLERLRELDPELGGLLLDLVDDYIDGINAGCLAAATCTPNWQPKDIVAATTVVRALFGAAGGNEVTNAAVFLGLVDDFGDITGREIYEDMRKRNSADGPVHTLEAFSYLQRDESQLDPNSTILDFFSGDAGLGAAQLAALGQLTGIDTGALGVPINGVQLPFNQAGGFSNYLIVGGSRTASGRPIMIGGPQTGYFAPQIVMELEVHSPSFHGRGMGFPGLSFLPTIGRAENYAWTATAGGSDMVDIRVEELCDPNGGMPTEQSRFYRFDDGDPDTEDCREMVSIPFRNAQVVDGQLLAALEAERTVHGPVIARGRIGAAPGMPVALVRQRSTFLKEADGALTLAALSRGDAATAADFRRVFRHMNLTTNWGYINQNEIAFFHGGLFPQRPASVDPDFPVWGTGEWEWQGLRPATEHPQDQNPARDFHVSWNNRVAASWGSADDNWGYSALYRADILEDRLLAEPPASLTPVRITQLMEEAGLTDFRASHVLPLMLRIMGDGSDGRPAREVQMLGLLADWIAADNAFAATRRDGDEDGNYDQGAPIAIMDAFWEPAIRAIFDPVLGDTARIPLGFDNPPGPGGSAYQGGFYGHVWTDLAMLLGDPVASATSRVYCGNDAGNLDDRDGDLAICRDRLWAALAAAGDAVANAQGSNDPASWSTSATPERILFLTNPALSMHWVNRPTYQQVLQFE